MFDNGSYVAGEGDEATRGFLRGAGAHQNGASRAARPAARTPLVRSYTAGRAGEFG
jgi:hypothetical protein